MSEKDRAGELPTGRVLLVDDEQVVHASVRKVLSKQGYVVEGAFTSEEALELLERREFDLVITDLMMPGMNGISLLQALQNKGIMVPIIMITGYPTIRTAVQAMRLGACDYIAKPFTRKELLGPVSRLLRRLEAKDWVAERTDPPSAASLTPGVTVVLAQHAWARLDQDGTFLVGVEPAFLHAVGEVGGAYGPAEGDVVEQGVVGLNLLNHTGEEHGVAMPLTGRVIAVNRELLQAPGSITSDSWLLRVLPSHLDMEIQYLSAR
jgi:DNA-binding response OmpR family regulator